MGRILYRSLLKKNKIQRNGIMEPSQTIVIMELSQNLAFTKLDKLSDLNKDLKVLSKKSLGNYKYSITFLLNKENETLNLLEQIN
jgi:hypothetical protein